ncbi:putative two-component system response regulator [Rhodoblastus acidophilus]|uniref:Putative two-component system response regulator n=1 Tax=Rhodoblastus acidophilus TaxID=1074 RepID=A0A212S695_RHOAC|nr:hypothetical protein CKO16_13760 [Rhodoblastus acidophilus]RAI18807.1 hypothetical protein CH337_13300 [Rhodoblastus acidophilus]SNB80769.1 putative two-component system response regulator [Rhodoblastus acidophilus]
MLTKLPEIVNVRDDITSVLVVDDSCSMLAILESTINKIGKIDVATCDNPVKAMLKCAEFQYDVILVDYLMPGMNGIDFLRKIRKVEHYRSIPIIMLTSQHDRNVRIDALSAGVNDFLTKPFDPFELRARLSNMLALRNAQRQQAKLVAFLTNDVEQAMREMALREKEMIWRLALAVEARDGGTGAHIARVAEISRLIALGMGMGEACSQLIYLAAPLHDVGKIGTPDAILRKPGPLTAEEAEIMRRHVKHGVQILRDGATELLRIAALIAGGHHERWDGSGYPAGLKGEDIPLEARIVAVADAFDAICSERAYKSGMPFEEAFAEIVRGAGSAFDPACVAVFKQLKRELLEIRTHDDIEHLHEALKRPPVEKHQNARPKSVAGAHIEHAAHAPRRRHAGAEAPAVNRD